MLCQDKKRLHTRVFNSLFVNLACENKSLKVNFNTIYKTIYTYNLVVKKSVLNSNFINNNKLPEEFISPIFYQFNNKLKQT